MKRIITVYVAAFVLFILLSATFAGPQKLTIADYTYSVHTCISNGVLVVTRINDVTGEVRIKKIYVSDLTDSLSSNGHCLWLPDNTQ